MPKIKIVTDYQDAVNRLYTDIGSDNVAYYDIQNFPGSGLAFYPPEYMEKCSSVVVAVSGDPNGTQWMVLCPFRVDYQKRTASMVHDIDPFIVSFDRNVGTASLSGVVGYHMDYPGRTTIITDASNMTKEAAVSGLRKEVITGMKPIDFAPDSVKQSLHKMVEEFKAHLE